MLPQPIYGSDEIQCACFTCIDEPPIAERPRASFCTTNPLSVVVSSKRLWRLHSFRVGFYPVICDKLFILVFLITYAHVSLILCVHHLRRPLSVFNGSLVAVVVCRPHLSGHWVGALDPTAPLSTRLIICFGFCVILSSFQILWVVVGNYGRHAQPHLPPGIQGPALPYHWSSDWCVAG